MKEYIKGNYLYYLMWIAFSAFICLFVFPLCSEDYMTYDTSYQYGLNSKSFSEMLELIPKDYSPPLYALVLKIFTAPFDGTLFSMRAFSLVVFVGIFYIALFPVRKAFGNVISLVYTILSAITATNVFFITEARPSVLAYFLVTASAVYTYLAYRDNKICDYVCITLFNILGMYTHNIAMLSVIGFYIVAGCFALAEKQHIKFKRFLISGIVAAVAYVPWLIVVCKQFSNVLNNYWVGNKAGFTWIGLALFGNNFNDFGKNYLRSVIFLALALCIAIPIVKLLKKIHMQKQVKAQVEIIKKQMLAIKDVMFMLLLLIVPVITIILFSTFVYPLLRTRYFYILTGVALLDLSIVSVKAKHFVISNILVVLVGINTFLAWRNYSIKLDSSNIEQMISDIGSQCETVCFIHSDETALGIMSYYFPDAIHYVHDDMFTVLITFDVFKSEIVKIGNISNLPDHVDSAYFVDYRYMEGEIYSTREFLDNTGSYEYETVGNYYEPYSYINNWKICKVTLAEH